MSLKLLFLCGISFFLLTVPSSLAFLRTPVLRSGRTTKNRILSSLSDVQGSFGRIEQTDKTETVESVINRRISKFDQSVSPGVLPEKCIIVGVDKTLHLQQNGKEELSTIESLIEMMELCKTAHLQIVGSCVQRMSVPNPKSYLGEGKMAELQELCKLSGAQIVVVDDDLSPRQQRSIEEALAKCAMRANADEDDVTDEHSGDSSVSLLTQLRAKSSRLGQKKNKVNFKLPTDFSAIKVLDRTAIILDIFAQHARSREGQLQVELAMMEYRSTRGPNVAFNGNGNSDNTVGDGKGSSGAGLRGPGESKLELDKRKIQTRILLLKEEIAKLQLQRQAQRNGRTRLGVPIVALVGYTNAGKSTILNRLSNAGVLAENMLFATLDPTTRKIRLPARSADAKPNEHEINGDVTIDNEDDADLSGETRQGMEILLTDTVGFISKLPSSVVAAFRATLESVADADVLVHVCDRSSPSWEKQRAVVLQELARIAEKSQHHAPIVEFWNKVDALPAEEYEIIKNEIVNIPIEMGLVRPAVNCGLSQELAGHSTQSAAQSRNADVGEEVGVDEEMYMCAALPDTTSQQRKDKKQTKNQKRDKGLAVQRAAPEARVSKVAQVFKVACDTTLHTAYANTPHPLHAALDGSTNPAALSSSADSSLLAEPCKHLIYTAAGSALTGVGIDALIARVEDALSLEFVTITLEIPYAEDVGLTSNIRLKGVVSEVNYTDTGIRIRSRIPVALADSLAKYKVLT